jgi:uncharacterized lipoprotein YmbA
MMRHGAGTTILCALGALIAGCVSTPASRFYTLNATMSRAAESSSLSVVVGPVSVPAAVDRPQIVVSTSPNQVRVDDFNRWASPLQSNISRVVADNLGSILGTPRVMVFPHSLSANADYQAAVEVQSFGSALGEAATLDAAWTVRRIKDGKMEVGRTTVREPALEPGYDALAAAHSRAVARLSQDIAAAVRALDGLAQPR